ncbi:type II secretion system F family protein [bacterium]|nr:type II secretion system F family protein [bacterium]
MEQFFPIIATLTAGLAGYFIFAGLFPSKFLEEAQSMKGKDESLMGVFRELLIKKIGVRIRKYMSEKFELSVRQKLVMAGEPEGLKPEDILAMMVLSAGVGIVFLLLVLLMLKKSPFLAILGALTFFMPKMWLNDQVKKRHHFITRELPYAIDLLTLSVEAGLDFSAAVGMVVEKGRPGPLREEFSILMSEMKMGKTREIALKNMMERVNLAPLSNFIRSLVQADRMGTSLGKILRIQSSQMRIERTQKAEKLANEAPVKMLFPLVACIFPTIFMVLFGPIIYKFIS